MVSDPQSLPISYRNITIDDLYIAHQLSQAVNWPHRIEDWQMVTTLGTGFVAEKNGQPIGTALYWLHDDHFASLGMVIVSPEHQGNGIGRKLMERVLNKIGPEKNILLFATPSGQPLYQSFGFKACAEVSQHQAVIGNSHSFTLPDTATVRSINDSDTDAIITLTEVACGLGRANVLNEILKQADGIVIEIQNVMSSFALVRPFGRGYVIGPIIAPSAEEAKILIQHCLMKYQGKFVRIDIPKDCGLGEWLTQNSLPEVDTVVRMVRGAAPEKSESIIQFGLISQALG